MIYSSLSSADGTPLITFLSFSFPLFRMKLIYKMLCSCIWIQSVFDVKLYLKTSQYSKVMSNHCPLAKGPLHFSERTIALQRSHRISDFSLTDWPFSVNDIKKKYLYPTLSWCCILIGWENKCTDSKLN